MYLNIFSTSIIIIDKTTIIISLTDIKSIHPIYPTNENIVDILKINCDDVDYKYASNPESRYYIPMSDNQAKEILNFVIKYKNKVNTILKQEKVVRILQ